MRVESVGSQTLTVHATGSSASDAVARSVRVVPDGLLVPLAQSGSLPKGDKTLDVITTQSARLREVSGIGAQRAEAIAGAVRGRLGA